MFGRWLSYHSGTFQALASISQVIAVVFACIAAVVAWQSWKTEVRKQQTEATLRYFDKLMEHDYVSYLWELQEFTLCFERSSGRHIS